MGASLVSASDKAALSAPPAKPLATQLALNFFLAAFALVLLTSGILYWATISALRFADDQVVDKRAGTVIELLSAVELNEGLLAHEVNEDNQGPRQIFIRVVTDYAPIALATEGMEKVLAPEYFPLAKDRQTDVAHSTIELPDGRSYRAATIRVPVKALPQLKPVILQVATDTTLDKDALSVFRKILISVILAAVPLCALAAWELVRRSLVPLQRITSAAQAIHGENIDKRIELTGLPEELHDLAGHFNAMLQRLEATYFDLKNYADALAHEMRTPLNRMRLGCEIALSQAQSSEELREVLTTSATECERLTRLLHGLLFLARADSKQMSANRGVFDLKSHLEKIREFFDAEASERSTALELHCPSELKLLADPDLLQQAITNLVFNALEHTSPGGTVAMRVSEQDGHVSIDIQDDGEGIPAEHHARLFDRYYRASQSSTATNNGGRLGLGLAIVKSIAELHGGSIAVVSEVGRGTRMTIKLPALAISPNLKLPAAAE